MSHKSALAALRAARAGGRSRLESYEVKDQGSIYEEVDEEDYKKVVRSRLNHDDFVVDDNGQGYADDGREDWQTERQRYSSDEEDQPARGKGAKRKREEEDIERARSNHKIANYFASGLAAKPAVQPKVHNTAEDEAFMASLLGDIDANAVNTRISPRKTLKSAERRKIRIVSPPPTQKKNRITNAIRDPEPGVELMSTPPPVRDEFDDDNSLCIDENDQIMSDPMPSSPIVKAVERKTESKVKQEPEDDEDLMEVAQVQGGSVTNGKAVNLKGARPMPRLQQLPTPQNSSPPDTTQDVDAESWINVTSKLAILSSPAPQSSYSGKMIPQDAVEEDGSLRMYWLDYAEIKGSLCLFGKVKHKGTGQYLSAFVKIDNILRKLYFLPRKYKYHHGRPTSEEVDMSDVFEEVDTVMSKMQVSTRKVKPCTRKYAFELPDIPKEAEYLKLLYPYDKDVIAPDSQGSTYSNVFGTNTSLFEQFVLWKNIMGPCWLSIEDADFAAVNNASWCKLECAVTNPKGISVVSENEQLEMPRLTLMSLAFRSVHNAKENKQEILVASARVYENVSLTDTTPPEKMPSKTFTVMRPYGTSWPIGFEAETKKSHSTFHLEKSEQMLLSKFMALFERMDPDVLMGHNLQDVDYSTLISRLREKRTPGWHRIGRLKRSEWPKIYGKTGGGFFMERQILAGRLMCDLNNDMGKSLMTKCQQWSLSEMCDIYLANGDQRSEIDIAGALASWASTREGLMNFVKHCDADTYLIAALILKLQMLPLTKVLTELAGNSWARTLSGTRAERNEYILLHEFHRNKYICPDKVWGKGRQAVKVEREDDDDVEETGSKKKDKYKGGLVFEPEKGLYDKFILVMDFNSLYPSIIQEYNICFTTVDRNPTGNVTEEKDDAPTTMNDQDEQVPEVPNSDLPQGVLPKLIATLVSRRREVKKLMKDKRATAEQLALWDTKQLALKLTANSMYGCLGYTQSRFYARPLAMLTTYKGREILRSTKELAESNSLQVIYGDTDSVMINTNVDNIKDALSVGRTFKKVVNDSYRLLEIDIDNIFRRLLLHAKKKYAAVNLQEIDGQYVDKLEVKGLDMKRREYCALSKEVSEHLLKQILSGEDSELVLERIHDYLREVSAKMRDGKIVPQKYTIYTKLGKDPKDYPQADSMPQVQVALREIAAGRPVRANDVMGFIVTMGSEETKSLPAPKRAYKFQDVIKKDSNLTPDVEYYLYKQIFPPIERLCAPIPGTDSVRLAECLGLDTRKYQISSNSSASNNQNSTEIFPLESQIPDSVRFKDASRLTLHCRTCKQSSTFSGLVESSDMVTPHGLICGNKTCGAALSMLSLTCQIEAAIRRQTSAYYEGWLVCDDSSCGIRTRQMSVYGTRCLGSQGRAEGCLGKMHFEYTEKAIYNQLLYYASLFDAPKTKANVKSGKIASENGDEIEREKKDKICVAADLNVERLAKLKAVVDAYLKKCGRQWVDCESVFAYALK